MTDLMPHQKVDAAAMAKANHALNWSSMGTGKTLSALEAFRMGGSERALVVAPPIALTMWAEEITKHTGRSVEVLRSGKDEIKGADFIVTTYALAAAGQMEAICEHFINHKSGNALILDESHMLKSKSSKRTQAIFGPGCNRRFGVAELFDATYSLTGTPITRYYDDLWAQLRPMKSDVLREYGVLEYQKFVSTFCYSKVKQFHPRQRPTAVVVGNKNHELLQRLLADCGVINRHLQEVLENMPPITRSVVDINNADTDRLARKLAALKAEAVEAGLAENDGKMMQYWQEMSLARVAETAEYIRDKVDAGPVLVGHWFLEYGATLSAFLREMGLTVAEVNGGTPAAKRDEHRDAFNRGDIDVLVGQMASMGVSWNIQRASSRVVMAEDNFSHALVDQFIGRIYRLGQGKHVHVDFIKSRHPIDDALTAVRERKADGAEKVL